MHLYIHLPFCLSHCIYCDFYVELKATEARRRAYLNALITEINAYLGTQPPEALQPIRTLYFGGGTPALFPAAEIQEILSAITRYAPFAADAEITLEANPEGMADDPACYRAIGMNRLSIGVQSFQPNELKRLSRVHSAEQARRFYAQVRAAGFDNVSLDLMYGIPEQTADSWQATLAEILALAPEHLSMYGLKVEPGTGMSTLVESGRMQLPVDDATVDMYFQALACLTPAGYQLYEISNLAKPGYESRHNLSYWENVPFWAFGASAHGYIDSIRYENPRDWDTYLADPTLRAESHFCSETEKLENAFIFGLRKREGLSIPALEATYGFNFQERYGRRLQRFFDLEMLSLDNHRLTLTEAAIPVSNEILAVFLEDN